METFCRAASPALVWRCRQGHPVAVRGTVQQPWARRMSRGEAKVPGYDRHSCLSVWGGMGERWASTDRSVYRTSRAAGCRLPPLSSATGNHGVTVERGANAENTAILSRVAETDGNQRGGWGCHGFQSTTDTPCRSGAVGERWASTDRSVYRTSRAAGCRLPPLSSATGNHGVTVARGANAEKRMQWKDVAACTRRHSHFERCG
jgi:hypothetical protein